MRSARLSLFLLAVAGLGQAADWPQFRGSGMSGVSADTGLPLTWGPDENVRWKAALPGRGLSSPIIVGNRVFITACSGLNQTRLHVLCFDCGTGSKLWERSFWATGSTICHPKTCVAAPTPVANADHVFALFASGDLVCFDHAGNLCWLRTLQVDHPAMSNLVGRSASPVLHEDVLIVPMENQGESFVFGLDKSTGRDRWRVERPLENNYTTPLLARHNGRTDLVVQAAGGLAGYDPSTGSKRWEFADETVSSIASPIVADDLVLGVGKGIVALRLTDAGPPEVVWRSTRLGSGTPTPLAAGGRLYTVKDSGICVCADLRTGKELWSQRMPGAYSGSPVLAGDKLYAVNEEGKTSVLQLGSAPEREPGGSLHDPMLATPAIAHGCLFLRSDRWLYCIGRPREAK